MSASAEVGQFLAGIQQKREAVIEAGRQALAEFAAMVVGVAQTLCPVDTGALAASGIWGDVEDDGDVLSVIVGFTVAYALAVHERLDLHHAQGQAKFLEAAIRYMAPQWAAFAIDRMKKVL